MIDTIDPRVIFTFASSDGHLKDAGYFESDPLVLTMQGGQKVRIHPRNISLMEFTKPNEVALTLVGDEPTVLKGCFQQKTVFDGPLIGSKDLSNSDLTGMFSTSLSGTLK